MDDDAVRHFWDVLLPGDGAWPAASAAIVDIGAAWALVADGDRGWLRAAALRIAGLAPDERVAAMQALEQGEPGVFNRVLGALYAAYYTTPAVHALVKRLAEAGPREASPHFDTSLVERVIATQAGLRRL
jgi:hypothetical protein